MRPTTDDRHEGDMKCRSDEEVGNEDPNLTEFTDIVGHGRWQLRIVLIITAIAIPRAGNHLGISFLAFPKEFRCVRPYFSNGTEAKWRTNGTMDGRTLTIDHCEMYSMANNTETVTRIECESWEFASGYESIIEKWNLVCDNDWLISINQSIYMIGFLFAVSISGQMSDIYGRRPTSLFLVGVILVSGFATAYATTFLGFVVARFFVAFGQAGLQITFFVLMFELIGSKGRAQFSILSSFGWSCGCMLLPALAWHLQNWQHLQLAVTVPSLLYISFYWVIPESPRWLLSKNKLKQAIGVMEIAASANGKHVKDIKLQAQTLYAQVFKNKEVQKSATALDLLRTPNLRRKTLSIYFIWLSISFMYYGLALNTNELHGDVFWNAFFSGLVEIPALLFGLLTIDRFGRRRPFIGCLTLGGVACFGCIFVKEEWWWIMTSLAMCGKFFVSASFKFAYIFAAEIFPTVARNVGLGSSSTVGRVGSALAPFMRDLGRSTDPSVPLAIFGVLSLISGLLVVFLPETKDQPIPETLYQAEEFGKFYKGTSGDSEPLICGEMNSQKKEELLRQDI